MSKSSITTFSLELLQFRDLMRSFTVVISHFYFNSHEIHITSFERMFHFTLFDHNYASKDLMGKSTAGELLKSEPEALSFSEYPNFRKRNFSKE